MAEQLEEKIAKQGKVYLVTDIIMEITAVVKNRRLRYAGTTTIPLQIEEIDGMVAACPVFLDEAKAKAYAGDVYNIITITTEK